MTTSEKIFLGLSLAIVAVAVVYEWQQSQHGGSYHGGGYGGGGNGGNGGGANIFGTVTSGGGGPVNGLYPQ